VGTRRVFRLTVFVPPDHVDSLLQAVEREIPLVFGQYDRSAWWSAIGVEQFRPLPGSMPTVGQVGRVEQVPTIRLEFAIPYDENILERVLSGAVIPNHPWQEPAVFIDDCLASATRMAEPDQPHAGLGD
jgi:hypothetical protein